MPSPAGDEERTPGGPDLITFGQMPDRLVAAGLPKLTHQRCRQLAETDPDWPIPMDQAVRVGRMRLFDWRVLEPYFRERKKRQGQRTDIERTHGASTRDIDRP
ncbi:MULTISPECIES: hypothetical protein [unclassified Streptomyces]|uniref:hypothetical protein n=1 Tax=unclassified Streptomyces TaxID=2593676 RepID=UPI000B84735D|nr:MULTISPECIES: hypothetical protein [unclassified Streptomyces]MYR28717.1 hypothetical protein [Streptomyces sp. SID4945]